MTASLVACGLDPDKCILFQQSTIKVMSTRTILFEALQVNRSFVINLKDKYNFSIATHKYKNKYNFLS